MNPGFPSIVPGLTLFLRVAMTAPWFDGGGERDRTDGLLLAKQPLSQLSYTPMKSI
jgi:hypothetical protein